MWSVPISERTTAFAVTEAMTTMPKASAENSRRMISRAKKTPAIGASNVAEMPPRSAAGHHQP